MDGRRKRRAAYALCAAALILLAAAAWYLFSTYGALHRIYGGKLGRARGEYRAVYPGNITVSLEGIAESDIVNANGIFALELAGIDSYWDAEKKNVYGIAVDLTDASPNGELCMANVGGRLRLEKRINGKWYCMADIRNIAGAGMQHVDNRTLRLTIELISPRLFAKDGVNWYNAAPQYLPRGDYRALYKLCGTAGEYETSEWQLIAENCTEYSAVDYGAGKYLSVAFEIAADGSIRTADGRALADTE